MPGPIDGYANAISAYGRASKGGAGMAPRDDDGATTTRFADLVRESVDRAIATGERSEQVSMAALVGKADLNQVVTAVSEAEVALQTAMTLRDKVLESYKEVMRMTV